MTDSQERRNSNRIQTGGSLRAQLSMETEVVTLSSRGMQVRLPFSPEIGSRHSFTLDVSGQAMALLGVIRNSEASSEGGRIAYHVGVEFEGMDKRDEELLEGFVARKIHE
jgi:hypothetical protein